jgi:energy-coupling factor transporter ATP-binding protein EcfA2
MSNITDLAQRVRHWADMAALTSERASCLSVEQLEEIANTLESIASTVGRGEYWLLAGFTGCGKSAIAGEIEIALKAIGVPVTWVNGDAEKRMTGADWLTAIEMYKPTVRIAEVIFLAPQTSRSRRSDGLAYSVLHRRLCVRHCLAVSELAT